MNSIKLCIFFIVSPYILFCQYNRYSKVANELFDKGKYGMAINILKKSYIIEKRNNFRAEILFRLGECYEKMRLYNQAYIQYHRADKLNYGSISKYKSAYMLYFSQNYEEAEQMCNIFLDENPEDKEAIDLINKIKTINKWIDESENKYIIDNVDRINSEYMDFAPFYVDNKIIFTSSRSSSKGMKYDGWTLENFSDIYISKIKVNIDNKINYSVPVLLEGSINTSQHEGTASYDKKKYLYFTRCGSSEDINCSIYRSINKDGKWLEEELVIKFDSGYVAGHPAIKDINTLYFSANIKGTKGGKDIFKINYNDKKNKWSKPINLGSVVNTEKDEMYPSFDRENNLYFASDGHNSIGGLDIFTLKKNKVSNLKYPFSSPSDDFGITFSDIDNKLFFSSNRSGGKGKDDIYVVYKTEYFYDVKGTVLDNDTRAKISGAKLEIEGSDGNYIMLKTNENGGYRIPLNFVKDNVSYKINISYPNYLNYTSSFNTFGIPKSFFTYRENSYVYTKILDFDINLMTSTIVIPRIEYDYNSAKLREESKYQLDKLKNLLDENPFIVVQLRSHTDHIGSQESNLKLSYRRAESCVKYLIEKGISKDRLSYIGLGENEPFVVGKALTTPFSPKTKLTEEFIKGLDSDLEQQARQLNRRTDFKVLGTINKNIKILSESSNDTIKSIANDTIKGISNDTNKVIEKVLIIDTLKADELNKKQKEAKLFYIFKENENFYNVSKKFSISVNDLRKLNGGLRAVMPFEGLKVKINLNADYSDFDKSNYRLIRSDISWEIVSKKLNIPIDKLKEYNPNLDSKDFRAGILIKIK